MSKVCMINFMGIDYLILKRIEEYIYLVNPDDATDFFIKKIIKTNDGEKIMELSDELEFDKALLMYQKDVKL